MKEVGGAGAARLGRQTTTQDSAVLLTYQHTAQAEATCPVVTVPTRTVRAAT